MAAMVRPMKSTTIQVTVHTRDELLARGRKGDTYDDIITRLLMASRGENLAASDRGQRLMVSPNPPVFVHRDRE